MKENLSSHIRGFVLSFISSLGTVVLATLSSLLGYNSNSLSDSLSTLVVFFAVSSVFAALIASVVSTGLFVLGSRKGRVSGGIIASVAGVLLLGFVFALLTQQISDYDVTLLLIIGCCLGSLTGPISFIVALQPQPARENSLDRHSS